MERRVDTGVWVPEGGEQGAVWRQCDFARRCVAVLSRIKNGEAPQQLQGTVACLAGGMAEPELTEVAQTS